MPWPCSPRRRRARSITSRTSFTPAVTADSCSKSRRVLPATASASVVLPVPGGPQNSTDDSASVSTSRRSGRPGPSRWSCPTTSSIVRGRIRAASGAWRASRSAAAERTGRRSRLETSCAEDPFVAARRNSTTWSISHAGSTHCQATNSEPSGDGSVASSTSRNVNQRWTWPMPLRPREHLRRPLVGHPLGVFGDERRRRAPRGRSPPPARARPPRAAPRPARCRPGAAASCRARQLARRRRSAPSDRSTTATTPARK